MSTRYTLTGLSHICVTATVAFVGLRAVIVASDVWLIWFIKQIESSAMAANEIVRLGEGFDAKMAILNIGFYVVLVISLVLNAIWLYRASSNAAQFVPNPKRMGPGFAVGCYFIPILQYFLPFKAMRETVNSSIGDGRDLAAPLPGKYTIWWGSWVIGSIGGQLLLRMGEAVSLEDNLRIGQLDLAVHSLFVVAGVIFITILRDISFAQDNRAEINTAVFE